MAIVENAPVPHTMAAVTIDHFGGLDVLQLSRQPVPEVGAGEVLIRLAYAGVSSWDSLEREGEFVQVTGVQPTFPLAIGSDGSGTVAAVGAGVEDFRPGELVYATGAGNPRGGFYAEYAVRAADYVSHLPAGLALDQAAALPIAALTALDGLADTLRVAPGEALRRYGASGDLGHLAVQRAQRLGARVLAVASGADGVAMVRELGADVVIDGRTTDIAAAARDFAPGGVAAILATASGPGLDAALAGLRPGGRVAYPVGVAPEPAPRAGLDLQRYDPSLDAPATTKRKIARLNELIAAGPFLVKIAQVFPLSQARAAHEALPKHRVGKLVLEVAP